MLLGWCILAKSQGDIKFDQDRCDFCGMIISDRLHAAKAVDLEGRVYKFDAIEGLINFLKTREESNFQKLFVADYANGGELTEAQSAYYLKSKNIPSPMGAFLTGFSEERQALQTQREKGGEVYNWEEIKFRFKDSRFGALEDHNHHEHEDPIAMLQLA